MKPPLPNDFNVPTPIPAGDRLLVSTENNVEQWTRTINHVRGTFKGRLTYSANWDHYREVKFWDQLDLIGMNSYWTLGPDKNTSVETIRSKQSQFRAARPMPP